jgi:hypothetical protein
VSTRLEPNPAIGPKYVPAAAAGAETTIGFPADERHSNICIRGRWPSTGVLKLALLRPLPSCASART